MMKGIAVNFCRPVASWPTRAATGQEVFSMVWSIVRVLWLCGITVKVISADGATSNFAFFDMAATREEDRVEGTNVPYRCEHPYDPDEEIFFCMDPPHLIKLNRKPELVYLIGSECRR